MSLPGQNSPILWIIAFSLMGSVGAICLAGSFLLCGRGIRQRLIPHLLSYSHAQRTASATAIDFI